VGTGEHPVAGTRKVKTNLDFTEARDSEWQWHQLGHMQTEYHVSTPLLSFFYSGCPSCHPTKSVKALCCLEWGMKNVGYKKAKIF